LAEFFVSTTAAGPYLPAGWRLSERFGEARAGPWPIEKMRGGLKNLAFEIDDDDKVRRGRSGTVTESDTQHPPARSGRKASSPGVGNALREAYQEALREDVPPEMLDLLGKLG
jgi:hypothetical protein